MQKVCCKCHVPKPLTDFTKNRVKKDGHNPSCKECHRTYTTKHYNENKPYYKKKARKRTVQIKAWVDDLKRRPCADCGHTFNPWQMDFDHARGEKEFNIAGARVGGVAEARIRAELEKCDVVCANCHRQRTHDRLVCPNSTMDRATGYEPGG